MAGVPQLSTEWPMRCEGHLSALYLTSTSQDLAEREFFPDLDIQH